jgi:membrane-bound serine protease (ClpP class)
VSPGTGILEVLAFFALVGAGLGTLYVPLNLWAAGVLVAGLVLLLLSLRLAYEQVWLGLSSLAFIVGSIFLFRLEAGGPAVHPVLAFFVSLFTLGFFWLALRQSLAAHRSQPAYDPLKVMDMVGEARTDLDPTGSIFVAGELWTARADERIESGAKVRIRARDGLILLVEPALPAADTSIQEGE